MTSHREAVLRLRDFIKNRYSNAAVMPANETDSSLEVQLPPVFSEADRFFEDIAVNFDSPSVTLNAVKGTATIEFDKRGTHIIHTGMDLFDAFVVVVRFFLGILPTTGTILKILVVAVLVISIQFREILARELEWRVAAFTAAGS